MFKYIILLLKCLLLPDVSDSYNYGSLEILIGLIWNVIHTCLEKVVKNSLTSILNSMKI